MATIAGSPTDPTNLFRVVVEAQARVFPSKKPVNALMETTVDSPTVTSPTNRAVEAKACVFPFETAGNVSMEMIADSPMATNLPLSRAQVVTQTLEDPKYVGVFESAVNVSLAKAANLPMGMPILVTLLRLASSHALVLATPSPKTSSANMAMAAVFPMILISMLLSPRTKNLWPKLKQPGMQVGASKGVAYLHEPKN